MKNHKEETKIQLLNMCNNIKFLRKKHNLTKKAMAERLKISTRSLSMLEKGIIPSRLSCAFLFYVFNEFDVPPKKIFEISLHD